MCSAYTNHAIKDSIYMYIYSYLYVYMLLLSTNSFSRIFVTAVVTLCALVNGGQHLSILYECWMAFLFFFDCGRSGVVTGVVS